jgi:ubiquinone/menaquinone biosynthesis C-methylase UbiE
MKIDFHKIFLEGERNLAKDGIFTWLRFLFIYLECKKYLVNGKELLDVACGDGAFLSWLAKQTNYVGLDINRQTLKS